MARCYRATATTKTSCFSVHAIHAEMKEEEEELKKKGKQRPKSHQILYNGNRMSQVFKLTVLFVLFPLLFLLSP